MSDTTKPNDGGQAFPAPSYVKDVDKDYDERGYLTGETVTYVPSSIGGLTVRDYFAAKAMASMIEDQRSPEYLSAFEGVESAHDSWVSSRAYEMADAMLKARAGR